MLILLLVQEQIPATLEFGMEQTIGSLLMNLGTPWLWVRLLGVELLLVVQELVR